MKGVSTLIAIFLILGMVVATASMVFIFISTSSSEVKNDLEEKIEDSGESKLTNFVILEVKPATGSKVNITIKNNGKSAIDTTKLNAYLNNTLYEMYSYTGSSDVILPGETVTKYINCNGPTRKFDIKVTGPYGVLDEVYNLSLPCG